MTIQSNSLNNFMPILVRNIFPYLSVEDAKHVSEVNMVWNKAIRENYIRSYEALKQKILNSESITIRDSEGLREVKFGKILGAGGCKKAISIGNGQALLVPNMDNTPLEHFTSLWPRVVYEEILCSKLHRKAHLLSSADESVTIFLDSNHSLPPLTAYIAKTFDQLARKKDWLMIVDAKDSHCSTWKREKFSLFHSESDRTIEKNWDSIVEPLLSDIASIYYFEIPVYFDSMNLAVMQNPSDSCVSPYQIRYFGFDFTSKYSTSAMKPLKERGLRQEINLKEIENLSRLFLSRAISLCEFGYNSYSEEFEESLRKRYLPLVQEKVSHLNSQNNKKMLATPTCPSSYFLNPYLLYQFTTEMRPAIEEGILEAESLSRFGESGFVSNRRKKEITPILPIILDYLWDPQLE